MRLPKDLEALRAQGFDVVPPTARTCDECKRPYYSARAVQRFCSRECNSVFHNRKRLDNPEYSPACKARFDVWYANPENRAQHLANVARCKRFVRRYFKEDSAMVESKSSGKQSAAILQYLREHGGSVTSAQLDDELPTRAWIKAVRTLFETGDVELVVRVSGQEYSVPSPILASLPSGPWQAPSPAVSGRMPGVVTQLSWLDVPGREVQLRDAVHVHGALTTLLGRDHGEQRNFALSPGRTVADWWVYWQCPEGEALASTSHVITLGERRCRVAFGPRITPRFPAPYAPGVHVVTLDTVTPVSIRRTVGDEGRHVEHLQPSAGSIVRSLVSEARTRLGVTLDEHDMAMDFIECASGREKIRMGGHVRSAVEGRGVLSGWHAKITARVNAPMRWLLECASRGMGLGARRGFGFGRIIVRDVSSLVPSSQSSPNMGQAAE